METFVERFGRMILNVAGNPPPDTLYAVGIIGLVGTGIVIVAWLVVVYKIIKLCKRIRRERNYD